MKVLVIGSKGFIGSHIIDYFQNGFEVWGCDVFTDYNETKYFLITSPSDFTSIFHHHQFDVCINASGAANVTDSLKNPARDFELNVHNVFLLLEAIRSTQPLCKFINLSSAAVYGNPTDFPVKESQILNPLSPYGFHKMQAEYLCNEYYTFFGIKTISVRIFSAYGPGLKKQILWDLYQKTIGSTTIELFGSGEETRDYIFIEDIVTALKLLVKTLNPLPEYNLASGEAVSLKELSNLFLNTIGWNGRLKFTNTKRQGDPDFWQADISKIKSIGFTPTVSMQEGIKKYVQWLSLLE